MTYDEARAAIESLFATGWTATPVAYRNVDFTPPGTRHPWVMLSVEPRETVQASFGGAVRRFRCTGVARLDIRVPRGAGTAAAFRLADGAAALFASAAVRGLVFEAAGTLPGSEDDEVYFSLPVEVPFWHDDFR